MADIPDKESYSPSEEFFRAPIARPEGYAAVAELDAYSGVPHLPRYAERREWFLDYWAERPAPDSVKGAYAELARLAQDRGPVHLALLERVARFMEMRMDCADFLIPFALRLLYQFPDHPLVPQSVYERFENVLLGFKYGPWEPGTDSMCTWTENHQILFAVSEYLAAQRFPDRLFTNSGVTGAEKLEPARLRIERWLELRFTTGFSEWLSHVYYDEDLAALLALSDFCTDDHLGRQARMVVDVLLADVALNSFRGVFGATHGRSYPREKMYGDCEATSDVCKLVFGTGRATGRDSMGAMSLALSVSYVPPAVLEGMARRPGVMENRQRTGFNVADAHTWGLRPNADPDRFMFLAQEAYLHPKTIRGMVTMLDRYRWWDNEFFSPFKPFRGLLKTVRALGLLGPLARLVKKDATRNTREEAHILTRRTEDGMISVVQDYRRGYGGDQQHIWQATLGPRAVVFTTHPGDEGDNSAGYWVGSGTLPRAVISGRTCIAVYKASRMPGLYMTNKLFFTHAWFPRKEFDEVLRVGAWFVGRKERGYVALISAKPADWGGRDPESEIVAQGRSNIWVCRIGSEGEDGSFEEFCRGLESGQPEFGPLSVRWTPPGEPELRFGWRGPLTVGGRRRNMRYPYRYLNPWTRAPFGSQSIRFDDGTEWLRLNFGRAEREYSREMD